MRHHLAREMRRQRCSDSFSR